ncbi:MAG: hypothetical protein IJI97_08865 [Clostridia bacterium]|nr:hypothetical protein [Clostridia bacterium]
MQAVSALYHQLLAANAPKEFRAIIAGVTYGQVKIVSASSTAALMDKAATIGNCVAKELNLVLRNPGEIPRMAQIQMQFRLNSGTQQSEWLPKGTFFIDTRDEGNGVLTIDAFDPMLKCDQSFTTSGEQGTWPRTDITVVNQICSRIGVTLDARTAAILTAGYTIQYPGYGEGAYTMREILGFIGSMYAGNWIITDENKLRLLVLGDMPDDMTNLLITEYGEYIVMGGYRIRVSR